MTDYITRKKTFTLPDGTKKTVKFRGRTVREAEAKRDRASYQYEQGLFLFNSKTTVARYVEQYQATHELTADAARRLERHVVANIGGIRVQDVRASHVVLCLNSVRGTSSSNIDKTWQVMNKLFRAMIIDELILTNPMDKVDKPKGSKGRRRPLNTYEKKIFLDTLDDSFREGRYYDVIFALIYGCGLRPGEARALAWSNVYLVSDRVPWPFIRVREAVKRETGEIGGPKTDAGYRDVPVPAWLVPWLTQMRAYTQSLLVFPGPADPSRPQSKQCFMRRWKHFFNRMDLAAGAKTYRNKITQHSLIGQDLTPYYLRHTYRTELLEAGINSLVAAYWMGHEPTDRETDIGYAHLTDEMIASAVNILASRDLLRDHTLKEAQR